MIRATFVMEQHVGHETYYQNLRAYVDRDSRVAAAWVPVTYSERQSWLNVVPLSKHGRGTLIGRSQTLRGLRDNPADIVFFHTQVPAMFARGLLGRAPYVLSTDITPLQYDGMAKHYGHQADRSGALKALKRHVNTRVFRKAAHLIPWTTWVKDSLLGDYGVSPARVSVIPVGVDLSLWQPRAETRDDQVMRILFVGGHFERKGGDLLLRAFRALPPGKATLDIVTRSAVPAEPGVRVHSNLVPNSPELVELFRTSDVFVMPTRADAFGIVAVEASASGLAVVMSDMGGAADIVVDGQTGYLIQVDDLSALVQRLSGLVADAELRRRMGRAARARAESRFDAGQNGRKIVDTLLSVAATRPGAALGAS